MQRADSTPASAQAGPAALCGAWGWASLPGVLLVEIAQRLSFTEQCVRARWGWGFAAWGSPRATQRAAPGCSVAGRPPRRPGSAGGPPQGRPPTAAAAPTRRRPPRLELCGINRHWRDTLRGSRLWDQACLDLTDEVGRGEEEEEERLASVYAWVAARAQVRRGRC